MPKDAATSCWLTSTVVVARPTKFLYSFTVPLPIINKQKARGMSWAVIKESTVFLFIRQKKTGHTRRPILVLSLPSTIVPVRGNTHDVITLRFVLRYAASGNPLESSGGYSFVCTPLNPIRPGVTECPHILIAIVLSVRVG
ncbi:hypothetical protein PoB_001514800 [Plakobranchus ocellatus]|uniref:Uncharacterized protein n=1 Tax=Plakobranchus ocellatus TaxID=259542 RepID=A0AAV3Z2A6_9GAST|nr:hypothetical protein PoB_001514800 [Plakobranchus ocellatus]